MTERTVLKNKIRQLDFSLLETALYLDAYPNDAGAAGYFRQIRCELDKATAEYEEKYGPLTYKAGLNGECWKWTSDAWPWESEVDC